MGRLLDSIASGLMHQEAEHVEEQVVVQSGSPPDGQEAENKRKGPSVRHIPLRHISSDPLPTMPHLLVSTTSQ
jgi:hypothetical protein